MGVLVHCSSGISRSATIVLAFLIVKGQTLRTAYTVVKDARPAIEPGTTFFNDLQELERHVRELEASSMSMGEYYGYAVERIVTMSGGQAKYAACVAAAERFGWAHDKA